ncbi:MAG: hypothetical protein K8R10_07715, partial [Rhodocyclales bacterium]|nr:hypothetical protein [Rhodocyclales bacterium]
TSLFLTAIALVSKQIIDWSIPAPATISPPYTPQWQMLLLPSVLGLIAFLFLRTVNYRIRNTRRKQFVLVEEKPDDAKWPKSLGLVGWCMALMPLLFGLATSYYFGLTRSEVLCPLLWIAVASLIALCVTIYLYVDQSAAK